MIQVFDNFLDKELFSDLKEQIFNNKFPWFFNNFISDKDDDEHFYFEHWFYNNDSIQSEFIKELLEPVLEKLGWYKLYRAKLNLFTKEKKRIIHGKHIDITNKTDSGETSYVPDVAILYMNTNDGGTWTEDDIINSVENRLLIMSGDVKHASITQTDEKVRILYNINYDGTTSN